MTTRSLRFGIVGGLGARAGADILNQLVRLTPVKSESDHRDITFEQKPLVEAVSVASTEYSPIHRKFYVFDALSRMEKNGCDVAMLPCFITHTFIEELRSEIGLKLISITEAIGAYLEEHHADTRRIGVLTTRFVRENGLFDRMLGPKRVAIYPGQKTEDLMMEAIYGAAGFKANGPISVIAASINTAVDDLVSQGAEVIVPGMTELPLILAHETENFPIKILPSNEIYARFALVQTSQTKLNPFKIGVLGGVGPAATVDFMSKIVAATSASKDQDHIKMLVEQNPQIPDRTSNLIGDGADPTLALYSTAKKLERGGADIIAIPCNTAHAYVDRIQRHLDIPIVNMLTETADHIRNLSPPVRKIGILATSGTIKTGLYQRVLQAAGLDPIIPDDSNQAKVMEAIYGRTGVKSGFMSGACAQQIGEVIEALKAQSVEAIILGCTELPLIRLPDKLSRSVLLIDPTEVLAAKCIAMFQTTLAKE